MSDIVERMRAWEPSPEDCEEAADEIERLRAAVDIAGSEIDLHIDELKKSNAEIERLRALLKEAQQYVSDAGNDEDPETQRHSRSLLSELPPRPQFYESTMKEAADEIERLIVERLRKLDPDYTPLWPLAYKAANEIERLRVENKELRAKLEQAEIYISDAAEASER
jgi:hypothetical protein